MKVKQDNKNKLTEFLQETTGIQINPNSIFDIQVQKTFVFRNGSFLTKGFIFINKNFIFISLF